MKNFVREGDSLLVTAPRALTSGAGALVGALFGVAEHDAANGAPVVLQITGVVSIAKATGAITQGALVYWDNTNFNVNTTASGNTKIGVAAVAAASGDATVQVRLNSAF